VLYIVYWILNIFELILLARVLLSWFPNIDRSNPIVRFIYDVTEPILRPIREMMPPTAMIDFSPIIVWLIIRVIRIFIGV